MQAPKAGCTIGIGFIKLSIVIYGLRQLILMKRWPLLIALLIAFTASGCRTHRGVTRYNTSKQMYKHPLLDKIPRSRSGNETPYHRKGRRDKVMNKKHK